MLCQCCNSNPCLEALDNSIVAWNDREEAEHHNAT